MPLRRPLNLLILRVQPTPMAGQRIAEPQPKLSLLQRHQEAEIALLILAFRLQQATVLNSIQHGQKTSINQLPFLVPLGIFRFCSTCSTPQV